MDVVVLADTHLRSADLSAMPTAAIQAVREADAVLHAGDVTSVAALGALRDLAGDRPFHAVLGNNDHELEGVLPRTLLLVLEGVTVAVVHDGGRREGRAGRFHRRHQTATVVVFGHSHVPCDEIGLDGQILFNPGSPTQRRAQPHRTIGLLQLDGGQVRRRQIRPV